MEKDNFIYTSMDKYQSTLFKPGKIPDHSKHRTEPDMPEPKKNPDPFEPGKVPKHTYPSYYHTTILKSLKII